MKFFSHITAIGFSTLILCTSIKATLNFTYYQLDPVGFIERLCENKERPELQCAGKCHLKKVAASQDQRQRTPENSISFKELLLFVPPPLEETSYIVLPLKNTIILSYPNSYSYTVIFDWFHPPEA